MEFLIHAFIGSILAGAALLSLIIIVHYQLSFTMWLTDKVTYAECLIFIISIITSISLDASLVVSLIHYLKGP